MKALTLKAPWAQAIVHGTKRIENRTWKPHADVMGEHIAIHCGKSLAKPEDYDDPRAREQLKHASKHFPPSMRGHIIGTARVVGVAHRDKTNDRKAFGGIIPGKANTVYYCRSRWSVVSTDNLEPHEIRVPAQPWHDPWWLGPIGWLLDDVRAVEPVPARGMPGLWTVPDEIELVALAEEVSL